MKASRALIVRDNVLPPYIEETLPQPEITTAKYLANCERVAEMLAKGCGIAGTAAKIGLARFTVDYWLKTTHFQALFEIKKEEYRQELLGDIATAAKDGRNWQAAAWLAERNKVFGDDYHAPAVKIKQQIDLTARIFTHLTVEDIVTVLEDT